MGRKPNHVILQYFSRGAKLQDNSNRYQFRCKSCGEDFPKGRVDSLTNHLTKKCPAISQTERLNAVFALSGMKGTSSVKRTQRQDNSLPLQQDLQLHHQPHQLQQQQQQQHHRDAAFANVNAASSYNYHPHPHPHHDHAHMNSFFAPPTTADISPDSIFHNDIWAPLETLAEVSRQIEASEKHDDYVSATHNLDLVGDAIAAANAACVTTTASSSEPTPAITEATPGTLTSNSIPTSTNTFDLHEQYTLDAEPINYDAHSEQRNDYTPDVVLSARDNELSPDTRLHELLRSIDSNPEATASAASVAAAATERLNSALLDPQLLASNAADDNHDNVPHETSPDLIDHQKPQTKTNTPNQTTVTLPESPSQCTPPWSSMTLVSDDIHGPASVNDHGRCLIGSLQKGGFRMDTSDGSRGRSSRARFDSDRRKQVQEVRRIGACIRCRILRKTCSKGTPCDTCKKVLSPRVWRTGCVRTRLSEYIDIYSAGAQIVMAQRRVNGFINSHRVSNNGVVVEASHFPQTENKATFQVLQSYPPHVQQSNLSTAPVVLLDNDVDDVPGKLETYMRQVLPDLIRAEVSPHVRITLETAVRVIENTSDELLKKSLELWGMVELMDRERGWTLLAKWPEGRVEEHWIRDDTYGEPYTNISMQLTAAAERKAAMISKNLLNGIQRTMQDGKSKVGFPMFLTVMIVLNCVEKTTWAFKAWEQENLRPKWPLEKAPGEYTIQGHGLCDLLRLLLIIRHILPKTTAATLDSPITTTDGDPVIQKYFSDLNVTTFFLNARHEQDHFEPTDSRSLEFLFSAPLLIP